MPTRVALKVAGIVVAGLAMLVGVAIAVGDLSTVGGLAVAVGGLLVGLWLLFLYYPKFDPTGATLWQAPARGHVVALTFDDGPGPETGPILDLLEAEGVKATFFFLGSKADTFRAVIDRARTNGHAIGNHGFSHRQLHFASRAEIEQEIDRGAAALGELSDAGGKKMLRTPHGFKSVTVMGALRRRGYRLIGWTAGVWDTDRPGVAAIVARTKAALRPGCILLLHDGRELPENDRIQTLRALPEIIAHCRAQGYRFVTIPELCS